MSDSAKVDAALKKLNLDRVKTWKDLDYKCERKIRDKVADEVLDDWERVGRDLGVSRKKLRIIKGNHSRVEDKAVAMLDGWSEESFSSESTCLALGKVLLNLELKDAFEALCKAVNQEKSDAGPPPQAAPPQPSPPQISPSSFVGSGGVLGDGSWPVKSTPDNILALQEIPPPPDEKEDYGRRDPYKMTAKPRGVAIIINMRNFNYMKDRDGTDVDAESLTRLFVDFGFYTNRYDDLTEKQMTEYIEVVSRLDHSKFDCLCVAVLTHGDKGKLFCKDSHPDSDGVPVDMITTPFNGKNCPTLIGKPKVFIFQACRGGSYDYGVEKKDGDDTELPLEVAKKMMEEQFDSIIKKAIDEGEEADGGGYNKSKLPTEADFVMAFATFPGFVSWRSELIGSRFIRALVETMRKEAKKEHFLDILTIVNDLVAEMSEVNKQMPRPVHTLRRKLYFYPGT